MHSLAHLGVLVGRQAALLPDAPSVINIIIQTPRRIISAATM